ISTRKPIAAAAPMVHLTALEMGEEAGIEFSSVSHQSINQPPRCEPAQGRGRRAVPGLRFDFVFLAREQLPKASQFGREPQLAVKPERTGGDRFFVFVPYLIRIDRKALHAA